MSSTLTGMFVGLLIHTCIVQCETSAVSATPCTNGGTECSGIANSVCDLATTPMCKCAAYAPMNAATCVPTVCGALGTCTGLDINSECSGATIATDTCRCKTGYSLAVDGLCKQNVTSTVCTATGKECNSITNAVCDTTTLKCKCGGISTMIANTCTGKACGNLVTCTTLDPNSECSGNTLATDKCRCNNGYSVAVDGKCRQDVTSTACTATGTECNTITNALCDTTIMKCKCRGISVMIANTCIDKACCNLAMCTTLDPNSECSGTTLATDKCRCKTGYSLAVDGICRPDVTSTVCTATGTECNAITNALCDTTALKCKCGGISSMIANTCTGKTCNAAATCTALDANSECSGATAGSVCQCKTTHLMGTDGICALKCIIDATCTAVDANSKCSGTTATDKCKCNTGYTMGTDGKCASGAATVLASMTMLFACLLARLF